MVREGVNVERGEEKGRGGGNVDRGGNVGRGGGEGVGNVERG